MPVRIREALATLPAYAPGRTVPGAVKLASNELSYPTLPVVADAIAAAVADDSPTSVAGINRYPDNGATNLLAALSGYTGAPVGRLIAGCGSVALCQQIVQAVAGDGDQVLFGWRSFEAYPIVTRITGALPIQVPVTAGHALDLDAMADAVTPQTRLIFVCTPNNPTGTAVTSADLESFLDRVGDDVLVVVDEAYREFDSSPDSPDGAAVAQRRPNVLALRTLSKAYGLAGLRVGYAVADEPLIEALRKVAIPFALNSVAQAAAVAALGAADELRPRWEQVISERARVTETLRSTGFEVPTSQANFVWLPLQDRAADFAAHCEQHAVIVRSFSHADGGGVRVTIGSPAENDQFLAAATSYRS
ncbi:histidinol-phosphate transaminase [Nakamurella lactea]|uniref:histidinol-phosphate transaminase n=1 Tax=Nakamurella lactea TaxID=459515 RepID=UPI00041421EA|nr:histidinol-phosphate transaminase [Nakamurella lactea]